jgi:hypothetical protein
MVVPTPIAAPLTAATRGLVRVEMAVRKGDAEDELRFAARCWKSLMSLPEVKVSPVPVSVIAHPRGNRSAAIF